MKLEWIRSIYRGREQGGSRKRLLQWVSLVSVLYVPIRACTYLYVPIRGQTCLNDPIRAYTRLYVHIHATYLHSTNLSREFLTCLSRSKGIPFDPLRLESAAFWLVLWNHWI